MTRTRTLLPAGATKRVDQLLSSTANAAAPNQAPRSRLLRAYARLSGSSAAHGPGTAIMIDSATCRPVKRLPEARVFDDAAPASGPTGPAARCEHMQQKMNRAELAAALGVSEAKVTALTVAPPRYGMKPVPAYEPSTFVLERSIEIGRVGDQHVVFNRTKIWADHRQIHSSAKTAVICSSADEARQHADGLRISAKLDS